MRWKKTIILNRYLSDCPYIRLVLFNEKDIYIVEYYGAAEPPVRCGESHLSGLTEPLRSL